MMDYSTLRKRLFQSKESLKAARHCLERPLADPFRFTTDEGICEIMIFLEEITETLIKAIDDSI